MKERRGEIIRTTKETDIEIHLDLDGGEVDVSTGIGFLDHMLTALGVHSGFGLYVSCRGDLDVDGQLEYSSAIKAMKWKDITLAFIMKTTDEPLTEYAEMNEKQHSFFAYDMNGGGYNATCLCSPGSRSTLLTCDLDAEVYFWFGSQS